MRVEELYNALEADPAQGGDYDNDYEVMAEDQFGRRYRVMEHRTGVDDKGMPCLMLMLAV